MALAGKVAFITGSSSGIGKAIALALASSGVDVVLAARRLDKLLETEEEIRKRGGKSLCLKLDVTDREQVGNSVKSAVEKFGKIDILVNNAGMWVFTLMTDLKEEEWNQMVDVNIKGTLNCIGAILPDMVHRKSGHIVNVSSDAGIAGYGGLAVYCGTKHFIEGLTKSMRQEVGGQGIKVTSVQPGDVDTPGWDIADDPDKVGIKRCKVPLSPDDIGRAVVYAVSQPPNVAVNTVLVQPTDNPY